MGPKKIKQMRNFTLAAPSSSAYIRPHQRSGCSSGVEHNLAKVRVERSNRFTRSIGSSHTHERIWVTRPDAESSEKHRRQGLKFRSKEAGVAQG